MDNLGKTGAQLRNEYLKDWRRRNPEKVRRYNRDYWEKKARQEAENDRTETKIDGQRK